MSTETNQAPRILLGGVPFGRDNVGDEAIIECVVNIIREICPEAELYVSTNDQAATGKKLNVKTYPLFGFAPPGFNPAEMRQAIRDSDVFIWSGATGLSDYPNIPLEMLDIAQQEGTKSIIFCTGKNDQLNPAHYTLGPGKRRLAFDTLKFFTAGILDLNKKFETEKTTATNDIMKRVIPKADLVILRDVETKVEVEKVIGASDAIHVGADPAITLVSPDLDTCRFPQATLDFLDDSEKIVGLCISAQSQVKQLASMSQMFDSLIEKRNIKLLGIPMNPITDAALLEDFRTGLSNPEAMHVIQGVYEPDEITAVTSKVDVVISSRLHLLILASITFTPFIGISRGTKVTNFTGQFDLPDPGSVDTLDLIKLRHEIERLLDEKSAFQTKAKEVRLEMMARLKAAKQLLRDVLSKLDH
jgi:polysaccharide pyruvyl transferase WcaK-like protein